MIDWHFTPYAVPLFIGTAVLLAISGMAWRRRAIRGAIIIVWLGVTVATYTLGYAFELGSVTLNDVQFWLNIEYIGITLAPVCLWLLILVYIGLDRFLTPLNILILLVIPAITLVFTWTNTQHEMIWRDMILKPAGDRYVFDYTTGSWYWINVGYAWVLLISGFVLLARTYRRETGLFRRQLGIMLAGTLIPFVFHALYLSGLFPIELDINPYALTMVALIFAWAIFNVEFLDLMPIARQIVLASMSDAVIVVDARDRVIDLNPPARRLVGPEIKDYQGISAARVFPGWFASALTPEDRDKQSELMIESLDKKHIFEMQLSPLTGRSGSYEGRLIVLRDITERKHAEQERERLLVELEAFAHTVAHDLKTPLTVIVGYSTLLEESMKRFSAQDIEKFIEIIARTGKKMDSIIEELLLLASVRKMDTVKTGPLQMEVIVAEAQERLDDVIKESQTVLTTPKQWPMVVGYAPWVEEVWVNYLSNAIKYGGTPPCVEIGADVQPDGMVRFWARDNGQGLTPEDQAQLFSEFARLQQIKVEGHGLGLSIVRRIVERLGGEVGVESTLGQGSVFSFSLPSKPQ